MRYRAISLTLFFLFAIFISNSLAQTGEDNSWNKIINIQGGLFGNGGGYSLSTTATLFPFTDILEVSFKIKYKTNAVINGGFELSKGHLGFQGNFGFSPANVEAIINVSALGLTQEEKEEGNISTFYGEGSFLFFPTGSGVDKLSPYLTIGIGGIYVNGEDTNEVGYLISYGGGLRIFFEEKYGLIIAIKGFYTDFGNVFDEPELSGEKLALKPIQATVGFLYRF